MKKAVKPVSFFQPVMDEKKYESYWKNWNSYNEWPLQIHKAVPVYIKYYFCYNTIYWKCNKCWCNNIQPFQMECIVENNDSSCQNKSGNRDRETDREEPFPAGGDKVDKKESCQNCKHL